MRNIPGIMLAAPASGSGKTVAVCGLLEAWKQQKKEIRACKCGPDYIDPMFHQKVLGIESENLDLYFSDKQELREIYAAHGEGADLVLTEGVMGYYDGMNFGSTKGSAWETAGVLGLPVVLVIPCKGMASSVLALLKGFLEYRKESHVRGVILNHISPMLYPRMRAMLQEGLTEMGHAEVEVLGYLPDHDDLRLESRHLGLVMPHELAGLKEQMERAGKVIAETVDLDRLAAIAEGALELPDPAEQHTKAYKTDGKVRLAVAKDAAFCFYYKENLRLLEEEGCELIPFSPLEDSSFPEHCHGLLLGGGYPELYGDLLEKNESMRHEIKEKIQSGLPCLAECGGFQYLQKRLQGADGTYYEMVGVLDSDSNRKGKLVRFGYVDIQAQQDGKYLLQGEHIRGHEFHYWDSSDNGNTCLAVKPDGKRNWSCIHMKESLFAGYPHLYYRSHPKFVSRFVETCLEYAAGRK